MRKGIFAALLLIAIAVILAIPISRENTPPFTTEQRRWLDEHAPRGHYASDSVFVNCEGGYWVSYHSDGSWTPPGYRQCWLDRLGTPTPPFLDPHRR